MSVEKTQQPPAHIPSQSFPNTDAADSVPQEVARLVRKAIVIKADQKSIDDGLMMIERHKNRLAHASHDLRIYQSVEPQTFQEGQYVRNKIESLKENIRNVEQDMQEYTAAVAVAQAQLAAQTGG